MDRRQVIYALAMLGVAAGAAGCGRRDKETPVPIKDVKPTPLESSMKSSMEAPVDGVSLKNVDSNGITLRIAEAGTGPLVVFVHGWPELWYSWRHQLSAVADAGYRAVALDVRGYGGSDKPEPVAAYTMKEITADVAGLIDALGEEQAILVGHDWGAPIVWNTSVLYPNRVAAVAGLSVPFFQRGEVPPLDAWAAAYKDRFFYMNYFQREGVAEAELEADVKRSLKLLYYAASGDADPEEAAAWGNKPADARMLDGLAEPAALPDWLSEADLDYFAAQFEAGGFRGPLNRYRAQNLDWEQLPQMANATIDQPSCFIAGTRDLVRYLVPGMDLFMAPGAFCTDFRGATLIEGEGHWVQQEAPGAVNEALLTFLRGL